MKKLSCLEIDVLIYIFECKDENGVHEDKLISDYLMNLSNLPMCCFDKSNVIKSSNCHSVKETQWYSDSEITTSIRYTLIQLKNKRLVVEVDKYYLATAKYEDIIELLKSKAKSCLQFHDYVVKTFDYFDPEELACVCEETENNNETHSDERANNSEEGSLIIRQSIVQNIKEKERTKILNYFATIDVVTMSVDGEFYKFIPIFATVLDGNIFFLLSPIFKSEFGDKCALVFARNDDETFNIVTDETFNIVTNETTTEKIFELYQRERNING